MIWSCIWYMFIPIDMKGCKSVNVQYLYFMVYVMLHQKCFRWLATVNLWLDDQRRYIFLGKYQCCQYTWWKSFRLQGHHWFDVSAESETVCSCSFTLSGQPFSITLPVFIQESAETSPLTSCCPPLPVGQLLFMEFITHLQQKAWTNF